MSKFAEWKLLRRVSWKGSVAYEAWTDMTPVGRFTIGIPVILCAYVCFWVFTAAGLMAYPIVWLVENTVVFWWHWVKPFFFRR